MSLTNYIPIFPPSAAVPLLPPPCAQTLKLVFHPATAAISRNFFRKPHHSTHPHIGCTCRTSAACRRTAAHRLHAPQRGNIGRAFRTSTACRRTGIRRIQRAVRQHSGTSAKPCADVWGICRAVRRHMGICRSVRRNKNIGLSLFLAMNLPGGE